MLISLETLRRASFIMTWALMVSGGVYASSELEALRFDPEVHSKVELSEHLSLHGYHRSALHYLINIYRSETLSSDQRLFLEKKMSGLEQQLSKQTPDQTLPDLEVMLHFDESQPRVVGGDYRGEKTTLSKTAPVRPQEFASNRIDKMKWVKRTLILAGSIYVGYRLHRILNNPEEKEEVNTVSITF